MSTRHLGAYTTHVASGENKGFLTSKLQNIQAPKQSAIDQAKTKPNQNNQQAQSDLNASNLTLLPRASCGLLSSKYWSSSCTSFSSDSQQQRHGLSWSGSMWWPIQVCTVARCHHNIPKSSSTSVSNSDWRTAHDSGVWYLLSSSGATFIIIFVRSHRHVLSIFHIVGMFDFYIESKHRYLRPWAIWMYRRLTKKRRDKLTRRLIRRNGGKGMVRRYIDKRGVPRVCIPQLWFLFRNLHMIKCNFHL